MNVGKGHWVFAAIFVVVFIYILIRMFKADQSAYARQQYKNIKPVAWVVIGGLVLLVAFKFIVRLLDKLSQ